MLVPESILNAVSQLNECDLKYKEDINMTDFNNTDFNNMALNNIDLNNMDFNNLKLDMFTSLSTMNIKVKSLDPELEDNLCDIMTSYWLVSLLKTNCSYNLLSFSTCVNEFCLINLPGCWLSS